MVLVFLRCITGRLITEIMNCIFDKYIICVESLGRIVILIGILCNTNSEDAFGSIIVDSAEA